MLSRLRTTSIAKGATMPCGDNRILTAFFDYLADRATALGGADTLDGHPDAGNASMADALWESRRVLDVLREIAALLDIDDLPLRTMAGHAVATGAIATPA
jgi:hypothetical protein